MQIHVLLEKEDLLTGEKEILADGKAIYRENALSYFEDAEKVKNELQILEDAFVLKRCADIESITHLNHQGYGETLVRSPFGDFSIVNELVSFERNDEKISVEYRLLEEEEIQSHIRLTWHLKGLS